MFNCINSHFKKAFTNFCINIPKNPIINTQKTIFIVNEIFPKEFHISFNKLRTRSWFCVGAGATLATITVNHCFQNLVYAKEKSPKTHIESKPTCTMFEGNYYAFYYNPIPNHIVERMLGNSYKTGCPIPIDDLAYIKILHYDMDGNVVEGEMIAHELAADDIMHIFKDLFEAKFPIRSMKLIDDFGGNELTSREANNSWAFCFKEIDPERLSNHALGIAIDLNPLTNDLIYSNGSIDIPGQIHNQSVVVKAFADRKWKWGANLVSGEDYQHFEKSSLRKLLMSKYPK